MTTPVFAQREERNPKQLIEDVGAWSYHCFGSQAAKLIIETNDGTLSEGMAHLNELCPLLGLGEEFGELLSAETRTDKLDALGDITIYMCDFCARESVDIEHILTLKPFSTFAAMLRRKNIAGAIGTAIGELTHCKLKRLQGIRGFDNPEKYGTHRNDALCHLVLALSEFAVSHFEQDIWVIANRVFNEVVNKRDWAVNPQGAAGE